jgi:ADP-heptose:LPS heptosyltransferase
MQVNNDILTLLNEKVAQMVRDSQRSIILQPGAIGDCIFTLPLVQFLKDSLQLGGVDILGHTEYIGFLPGRSCVDGIRSIDSADLHRLFVESNTFDLADRDPLINTFDDYTWIVTFLGEPNSNFEQNLIFTANCSHCAEVITLSMKPPKDFHQHLTTFYTQQFINQSDLSLENWDFRPDEIIIKALDSDRDKGRELLEEIDFDFSKKLLVIQPGSGGAHKCWHIENFLAIAREIGAKNIDVIFLLGPAELERFSHNSIKDISNVGRCLTNLSLTEVVGLLSCAEGFIGNDSGITHLAAGLGIKTVAIFGPTSPAVYRPIGPAVTVFEVRNAAFAKKPLVNLQKQLLEVLLPID